ncbi:MAG: response regulator [Bacteroidia bacterium]
MWQALIYQFQQKFSEEDAYKNIPRVACVLGGIAMLNSSFMFDSLYPESAISLWDRYLIAGIMGLAFLGTFWSKTKAFFLGDGFFYLICIYNIDMAYIDWSNHFHPFYAINTFITFQLSILLLRNLRCLKIFTAINVISYAVALIFAEQILVGSIFSFASLLTTSFVLNYYVQQKRLTQSSKMLAAQDQLRKLSLVAEKTTNGVGIMDAKGNFEWVNQTFEAISGYTKEEAIGQSPIKLLAGPDTSKEELSRMMTLLSKGESYEGEILYYSKSGKARWQVMTVNPIFDEERQLVNYIAVETDITARKKMENHLRLAKEEAESAGLAKAEFLANMSHEIRTPMNAVIGMTGLLVDSTLSDEQRDYVETIRVSGDNLLTVINDILDFSKIDSGMLELESQAFNLVDSVEDVLDMLSPKAYDKNIELMYEMDKDVPEGIMGDPTRLNQILVNLVNNAIKFTDQGHVVIHIKNHKPDCNQACELEFSVKDTGIGIPEDRLVRLFKSFSQVDASTTRKYGGTGLGLAISKRLVNLMGGEIWVESSVGVGSSFSFTLPFVKAEISPSHQVNLIQLAARNARILLVDDNITNLRILESLCQGWGIETVCISDPRNFETLLADNIHFDLAILDMNMPHLDGTQLAKSIKGHKKYHELPLIMLSSMADLSHPKDRELFSAYLSKPFRKKQLLQNLAYILLNQPIPNHPVHNSPNQKDLSVYNKSILLVEDNLVNQKVALRMLNKIGLTADVAGNGLEALKALENRPYDVLLMDMQMPEMDGITATKRIREIRAPHFSQPIIIAMTANAMKGDKERCLESGMDDYMSKPIKLAQLAEILTKWLEPTIALKTNS